MEGSEHVLPHAIFIGIEALVMQLQPVLGMQVKALLHPGEWCSSGAKEVR